MNEEIFDVVNERDEVLAQKPRSEVHRLGLMHRAAHVLVFNSRGQVFLRGGLPPRAVLAPEAPER